MVKSYWKCFDHSNGDYFTNSFICSKSFGVQQVTLECNFIKCGRNMLIIISPTPRNRFSCENSKIFEFPDDGTTTMSLASPNVKRRDIYYCIHPEREAECALPPKRNSAIPWAISYSFRTKHWYMPRSSLATDVTEIRSLETVLTRAPVLNGWPSFSQ